MKAKGYFRDIWGGGQKRHSKKMTVELNVLIDEGGGVGGKHYFRGKSIDSGPMAEGNLSLLRN